MAVSGTSCLISPSTSKRINKMAAEDYYSFRVVMLPYSGNRAPQPRTTRISALNKNNIPDPFGDTRPKLVESTVAAASPQIAPTDIPQSPPPNVLASNWLDIHGSNDWTGMLDPINPILRSELIRYGEMAQASYDAYEQQPHSSNYGNCKYEPQTFFHSLGLTHLGYNISRYIYSTSTTDILPTNFFHQPIISAAGWSPTANWIGYVAVSDDTTTRFLGRRDITISWRGTVTSKEWLTNLMIHLESVKSRNIPSPDRDVKVQSGFLFMYTDKNPVCPFSEYSPREQILSEVKRLLEEYKDNPVSITLTGHSLGGAMAMLSAYDMAETGTNVGRDGKRVPLCVVSFGGPRVGNERFKERVERLGVKVIRVVNVHDRVVDVPGLFFNEKFSGGVSVPLKWVGKHLLFKPWCCCYEHVGVEIELDHKASPYLKQSVNDLSCFHNLEVYLHLLNGYHGVGKKFELVTGRDTALVNKYIDFLKDEMGIPPTWFQTQNKGMFEFPTGQWSLGKGPDLTEHIKTMNSHINSI